MTNVDPGPENGPRRGEVGYRNADMRKADAELAADPPELAWEPGPGGVWVGRVIHDPDTDKPKTTWPTCDCNLYGSPRRKFGDHHERGCGRFREQR